ncbi:dehydrodolichyl diphosphate synthase complex subunit DHDDS-like [Monomorium pharaonis]|uniref:dehydrodolichyl diphosphate synthase complex subunit DHDDS-like n=1 Tax=Monomorium pharaonis TaxID=307658 RepID=UPI001745EB2D|nr:dehydrodolichyl diphosphate synthase complex subunit DHDDS-like [Monomorium pharaonis]XP_036151030.1 dehydrodolichyl diphosphate synthase complex subunit DHDDS-like [Monomorium pharaonis]
MWWILQSILNWIRSLVLRFIKTGAIPTHIAFIMDGNRRYAKKRKIARREGHFLGFEKMMETLKWCLDLGITEITVYAFSINNFKRSEEEVNDLMDLIRQKFKSFLEKLDELKNDGICIRVFGNLSLLPEDVCQIIARCMIATKDNNKIILNIACPYTSKDELTHAIKDIAKGIKHNNILPEDINEDLISDCLYTYKSSNPDLLIRTSGVFRLSDFLMWQVSNTCIYFTDVLWPEFTSWKFLAAIFYYQRSDSQKVMNNLKPIVHNSNKIAMFVDKIHHERETIIENISNNYEQLF